MLRERWLRDDTVITYAAPEDRVPKQAVIRLVERLSGRQRLVRVYEEARRVLRPGDDIWALAVRSLDIEVAYSAERLAAVPTRGPLVVVANHPFGVIDGLVLCHLIALVRRDVKVVAMSTLCRVPEVRDHVLPIDFAGTRAALEVSARSRRAAKRHLLDGGSLIIFPAGEVATARRVFGPAREADWHPFAGRLVTGTGAAVLPVRFDGQNSLLFQFASRLNPTLRLSLLMKEATDRIGTRVIAHVGHTVPHEALRGFADPRLLVEHLRRLTHATSTSSSGDPRR